MEMKFELDVVKEGYESFKNCDAPNKCPYRDNSAAEVLWYSGYCSACYNFFNVKGEMDDIYNIYMEGFNGPSNFLYLNNNPYEIETPKYNWWKRGYMEYVV